MKRLIFGLLLVSLIGFAVGCDDKKSTPSGGAGSGQTPAGDLPKPPTPPPPPKGT
jgi:hypothetical protein